MGLCAAGSVEGAGQVLGGALYCRRRGNVGPWGRQGLTVMLEVIGYEAAL